MARNLREKAADGVAKRLWSGDVRDGGTSGGSANLTGGPLTYRKQFPVSKEDGVRRGVTPNHINNPQQGKARPFDPFSLRKLADTEPVQIVTNTIIKDMRAVPLEVVPLDDDADPPQQVMVDAERAMQDPNPNPEKLNDVNEMLLRDGMETGNSAAVINLQVDGRRAEVIPHDPNTFAVDWSQHRILEEFWQYPNAAGSRFGNPNRLDSEQVMWGVANPETQRAGFYGHGPVEKVQMTINVIGGLVESEIKELEEGMPPGIVSLVGDSWTDDDYDAFENYWKNEVKGEQHKAPYTRGEAEFVPFNHSYQELQILERQQWYHKLVGSAFNVPVSESGLQVGETTRATDVSIRQKYKQNALRPWLEYIEDIWTYQYLHRYWSDQIKAQYNPGLDLMERKELANIHSTRLSDGVLTVNEVREEMGKEEVEWGDEPFDRQQYARQQGGGMGGFFPGSGSGRSTGDGGGSEGGQTPGEEQTQALEEGQEQNQATPGEEENFSKGRWLAGLLAPGASHVEKADEPLREGEDNPQQFALQPKEIEELHKDLEDTFTSYIQDVMGQVKDNQHLLRDGSVGKSTSDFIRIIQEEIGLDFAEDVAQVLTEHKAKQILAGEEDIIDELAAAGISRDDLDLEQVRDRVVSRINKRTLKVTKPVGERLEDDLRGALEEGWNQGKSIEDIERHIEDITDKWRGTDAERLARDQLGKAAKEGRMEYASETEQQVGGWMKTWLATGGSGGTKRTRESHTDMHDTTVPREEPFVVNYIPDGGPASVQEDFPGESRWGIQCRCDMKFSPKQKFLEAKEWRGNVSQQVAKRIEEVEDEQGQQMHTLLLEKELDPGTSRQAAAQELGVSKHTYYNWLKDAGLYES